MRINAQQTVESFQNSQVSTDSAKATIASSKLKEEGSATANLKPVDELIDTKGELSHEGMKEKLKEAVDSINEFLQTDRKTSKFVFHEGLHKYYVRLVNADTEEVIKEIPPERLLDAFYQMQKLAGMIVDEKI